MHSLVTILILWVVLCIDLASATWVDPDSPIQVQTATSHSVEENGTLYQLVFSDEFQQAGRTFHDGNDPRWTAMNKNDCKRQ